MVRILLFIFLFPLVALAAEDDRLIRSLTAGYLGTNSSSNLTTAGGKDVLNFDPNVSSAFGTWLQTKYIGIGYLFSNRVDPSLLRTHYDDIRVNFAWKNFDVRLNYQRYKGAVVDENGAFWFYRDYEVKSKNARAHYYFTPEHLKHIREGWELVAKAASNSGFTTSSSIFWGLNVDSRAIKLPGDLVFEHQQRVLDRGIDYKTSFSALSYGPLVGGDLMALWGPAYFRGKVGAGPAFQSSGGSQPQFEIALNLGFAFFKRHLISLGADIYSISFKDDGQRIANSNIGSFIGYTYAFMD